MTLDEFIKKWTNKPVDFDGVFPNQCMDLMHQYVYDVLGLKDAKILAANPAKNAYLNYNKYEWSRYFIKEDNTPYGIPYRGDIIFWGSDIGKDGHVAIYIDGDVNSFNSFDANWPNKSLPHIQAHSYRGVLGWLHPKSIITDPATISDLKKTIADLTDKIERAKAVLS